MKEKNGSCPQQGHLGDKLLSGFQLLTRDQAVPGSRRAWAACAGSGPGEVVIPPRPPASTLRDPGRTYRPGPARPALTPPEHRPWGGMPPPPRPLRWPPEPPRTPGPGGAAPDGRVPFRTPPRLVSRRPASRTPHGSQPGPPRPPSASAPDLSPRGPGRQRDASIPPPREQQPRPHPHGGRRGPAWRSGPAPQPHLALSPPPIGRRASAAPHPLVRAPAAPHRPRGWVARGGGGAAGGLLRTGCCALVATRSWVGGAAQPPVTAARPGSPHPAVHTRRPPPGRFLGAAPSRPRGLPGTTLARPGSPSQPSASAPPPLVQPKLLGRPRTCPAHPPDDLFRLPPSEAYRPSSSISIP